MRNVRAARLAMAAALPVALVTVSACGSTQTAHPVAASVAARLSRADRNWIDQAHQADMAEKQVGQLAELDGGSQAIRTAGAALTRDHQALDNKLTAIAKQLKLALPTSMTVQQTETGDRLSREAGHRFDHDFTASMMTAHQSMIAATRREIAHGSSPQVVKLAEQALPVLIKHLKTMQAAAPTG